MASELFAPQNHRHLLLKNIINDFSADNAVKSSQILKANILKSPNLKQKEFVVHFEPFTFSAPTVLHQSFRLLLCLQCSRNFTPLYSPFLKIVDGWLKSREGEIMKEESNFGKENMWKLRICKLIFLKLPVC